MRILLLFKILLLISLCESQFVQFINNKNESDEDQLRQAVSSKETEIVSHFQNVTVETGQDVNFTCIVNNLGIYKLAWLRVESKNILTIHHHVITRNYRIRVIRSTDYKVWTLHIENTQKSDSGGYMCSVNTEPLKNHVAGYLYVTDQVLPTESAQQNNNNNNNNNNNVSIKSDNNGNKEINGFNTALLTLVSLDCALIIVCLFAM